MDPRMNEYQAIKCDDCNNLYYTPETTGKCDQCGSDNITELTHAEADQLFREAMKKSPD